MTLKPGEHFANRYKTRFTRGAGSTGVVYQAEDLRLQRLVALKMMHEELAQQPSFQAQFEQEARLLAGLGHPAIIPLFDFNSQPQPHLVMPYYDDNLGDYLLRNGNNVHEIIEIGIQIGQALGYLHTEAKKIHGDVKPENILLKKLATGQYQAVLTDFGLSQLQNGEWGGTPTYMSPEQCLQHETDGRSDIYALGVVLYELLAKSPPFMAETPEAARQHHQARTPLPSLARSRPDLPRELVEAIMTMLAPNPDERYEDALTAVKALRAVQPSPTFTPPPPPQTPPPSEPSPQPNPMPLGSHLSISQQLPRQIQLEKKRTNLVIGSDPEILGTDIVLRGSGVAPKHAELLFEANNWSVIPLDKEKPVYLNGQPIYDRTLWDEYKTLQIGTHFLRLNLAEETLEKGRAFDLVLSVSRMEMQPNSKQRVEVVIQNNARQRGYYQIKAVSPPPSSETGTLIPDGWLNIKHNGTPILPGEQATLPIDIAIPADAKPDTYWYAIEADSLATNDGSLTVVGTVAVSARADFVVQVNSTQLLENQVCWLSITNQGNQEQVFYFTLSDMEQELLFGLVPKDKVPAASSENGRSQPTRSGTPFTIPPAQSALGGFRSLPFLRTFFDPLRQNWLSRWWRRGQSQVRYVRGLGRYLPNAPQPTAQLDQATTPLPPAFFYPQEYYSRVEEGITIASQSTERIGFVVEAKERPFTARHAQNHAFTLNVRASIHGQENSRAATVTIQPRYSFKATAAVLGLLALLPLLLWLFIALSNSNLRQLRADARAFAAQNPDGDSPDNGAEVLLFTDPKYPPATETPTPIPFTTSIAILVPTPPLTPTATLPTQLFSVAGNDGYLVMRGKQVSIFANEPVLHVGDTADNGAARAIVSFDTSAITSSTNIRSVELFLSPVEPTDENAKPIGKVFEELGSYLYADMAPGGFGFDLGLGQGDFSAQTGEIGLQIAQLTMAPNGVQVLLRFGNNQGKVIAALQQHDVVEFRLYFLLPSNEDDSEAQYVLVSGDSTDEEKRPYLEITYGP